MEDQSSNQSNQLRKFNESFGSRFEYNSKYSELFDKHIYCTQLNVFPCSELQMYILSIIL